MAVTEWIELGSSTDAWVNSSNAPSCVLPNQLINNSMDNANLWPPTWFGTDNEWIVLGGFDFSSVPDNAYITGFEVRVRVQAFSDTVSQHLNPYESQIHSVSITTNCYSSSNNNVNGAYYGSKEYRTMPYTDRDGHSGTPGSDTLWPENFEDNGPSPPILAKRGLTCSDISDVAQAPNVDTKKSSYPYIYGGGAGHDWMNNLVTSSGGPGGDILKEDLDFFAVKLQCEKFTRDNGSNNLFYAGLIGLVEVRAYWEEQDTGIQTVEIPMSDPYSTVHHQVNNRTWSYGDGAEAAEFVEQAGYNELVDNESQDGSYYTYKNPSYALIGAEAYPIGNVGFYNIHRMALTIDVGNILKNDQIDFSTTDLAGISFDLVMRGEWNLGSSNDDYEEILNRQFDLMIYKGHWSYEPTQDSPSPGDTNEPIYDDVFNVADEFRGFLDWRNVDLISGPYNMWGQHQHTEQLNGRSFIEEKVYKIHIGGDFLDALKDEMNYKLNNTGDYSMKLLFLHRNNYTYTAPHVQPTQFNGGNNAVVNINKSSIKLHLTSPNRDFEGKKINSVNTENIKQIGAGEGHTAITRQGAVNSAVISDQSTDESVIYDVNFLKGTAINGGVSFDNPSSLGLQGLTGSSRNGTENFVGEIEPGSGIWANGTSIQDLYDYTIDGPDETNSGRITPTHNMLTDNYPRATGWTLGRYKTQSSGTGPPGSFTTPQTTSGRGFASIEASSPYHHSIFRLQSSNISLENAIPGTVSLSFHIHMYSSAANTMGRFFVDVAKIIGGTNGLQDGTIDKWKTQPMQIYWAQGDGVATRDTTTSTSLGFENLDGLQDTNAMIDFNPNSIGGRIQAGSGGYAGYYYWPKVVVPLDEFINPDDGADSLIRIQFRHYTRPGENTSGQPISGYCKAPSGDSDCLYDLGNGQCITSDYSPQYCDHDWYVTNVNRAGSQHNNYWRGDAAIDAVVVSGKYEDTGDYRPIQGTVQISPEYALVEGNGTDFAADLTINQLVRISSDSCAPGDEEITGCWEYFRVDNIQAVDNLEMQNLVITPVLGTNPAGYQGSTDTSAIIQAGPMSQESE